MNFLNTTVEPWRSVVKKTRVIFLLPNSGTAILLERGCFPEQGIGEAARLSIRQSLVWGNLFETLFERDAASLVDLHGHKVQDDRQDHVETHGHQQPTQRQ